jgi:hypothetical protein
MDFSFRRSDLEDSLASLSRLVPPSPPPAHSAPSYPEVIKTLTKYFEIAHISPFRRRVLFAAYAPVHQSFLAAAFISGLEGSLPFSLAWLTFSRTYHYLRLDDFFFDPSPYLEPIADFLTELDDPILQLAFDSFSACFQRSNILVETESFCQDAISTFRTRLNRASGEDLLRPFDRHFQNFIVRSKLQNIVRAVDDILLLEPLFVPDWEAEEKPREILSFLLDFAILVLRILVPDGESVEAIRSLRQFSLLLLYANPDTRSPFFKNLRDVMSPIFRFPRLDDLQSLRELTNFAGTRTISEWRISHTFHKFLRVREHIQVDSNDFRRLVALFSALIEFLGDFESDEVCYPGDHLLGNYSGRLIQSCVIEELEILTYFKTKILPRPESTFLGDLENLIAATQDLVTSKVLDAAYRDFFERFLIYLKILQAVFQALSALTIQKIKPDMLEFFPDVQKLSAKCAALPDFGVLTAPIEEISFSDAANLTDFAAKVDLICDSASGYCETTDPRSLFEELRKVAAYQMQIRSFMTKHVTQPPERALLYQSNAFAGHLKEFFDAMMPIIQDRPNSTVNFAKLCFDLALCVIFEDYASPATVGDRWRNALKQLAIPMFPRSVFDWVRSSELYFFLEEYGHIGKSNGLLDLFHGDLVRFMSNPTDDHVQAFRKSSQRVSDLLSPSQPHFSFLSIFRIYDTYRAAAVKMTEICRTFYSINDISSSYFLLIMLANVIISTIRVLSFAVNEGFLTKSAEVHAQSILSKAAGFWPKRSRFISSVNNELLETLYPLFHSLMNISFVDVKPVAASHINFLTSCVTSQVRASPHVDPSILGTLVKAAAKLRTSIDWASGLFEILRCVRLLEQEIRRLPNKEDARPVQTPIAQFSNYVMDCISALSFNSDLIICLNTFANVGAIVGCRFGTMPMKPRQLFPAESRVVRDEQRAAVGRLLVALKADAALRVFHHIEAILRGLSVVQLRGHVKEILTGLRRINADLQMRLEAPPFDANTNTYRIDASGIDDRIGATMEEEVRLDESLAAARAEVQQLDEINTELEKKLGDRQIPTRRIPLLGVFREICSRVEANDPAASEAKALLNRVDLLRKQNGRLKAQLQRKRILDAIGRTAADGPQGLLEELRAHDVDADVTAAVSFVRTMTTQKIRAIEKGVMQSAVDRIKLFISTLVDRNRAAREAQKVLIEELREIRRETVRKRAMMAAVLESA